MNKKTLSKGYEPAQAEEHWNSWWAQKNAFTPDINTQQEPYSLVIPPPNVTGQLHIGHAFNLTLQDILCRYQRQQGKKVLWVPGMDHAGIATQNVVERMLAAEGKTRDDLGREAFTEKVWEWKEEYGGKILRQIRRMGASVDWTRERFTMDKGLSRAVREVFVDLYEQGLIYKGDYIINWCMRCQTALADDEVEHEPHQGNLYQIAYKLEEGSGQLVIATTRPETLLADSAVAVHPDDERYRQYIGRHVLLPVSGRKLPVIADSYVDREFGTGCLKVTPAHDMNDWELGRRHDLPVIRIFTDQGTLTEDVPPAWQGLSIKAAREKIIQELKEQGQLLHIEPHEHAVGECYRCHTVVEPHVSTQWFVAVSSLAKKARDAVVRKETTIYPQTWEKTYFHWLDTIRDWCISRQLWWGHRIPAWTCSLCNELLVAREDPVQCPSCGATELIQEDDVLDTWFSSALWPFSTMGWPDKTKDLETFYPGSCLVTAFDILFFWVARMMMMGLHCMQEVPFREVYIHALIRDAQGKKMSKSTGNVIDPLVMCDKYGTDSLRFTLTALAAMGRDIRLSEERIEGYRHFMNKLWNAARFALMHLDATPPAPEPEKITALHHLWILHCLEVLKTDIQNATENYRFNELAQQLYAFTWHSFCDWYLEMVKNDLFSEENQTRQTAQSVLYTVLSELLILAHPVIPFITQEIYTSLPDNQDADIAAQPFPAMRPQCHRPELSRRMDLLQQVITGVRTIRAELGISPAHKPDLLILSKNEQDRNFLQENEQTIYTLAQLKSFTIGPDIDEPAACASTVVQGHQLFVPFAGVVDVQAECERLTKELGKIEKQLAIIDKKLNNPGFLNNAPANIVQKEQQKAKELHEKQDKLTALSKRLKK